MNDDEEGGGEGEGEGEGREGKEKISKLKGGLLF